MRRLLAFFLLRCPHCYRGPIFASLWRMHEHCPVCGVVYERETGYFMNAIFFGYVFGFLLIVPLNILLYYLDAPLAWFGFGTLAVLVLFSPLVFRYSRALWMHLDEMFDPRLEPDQEGRASRPSSVPEQTP